MIDDRFVGLPGADIVSQGLRDLAEHKQSEEALLVLIAAPRLRGTGILVGNSPDVPYPREHQLYMLISSRLSNGAHAYYSSLLRRMTSFVRAADHIRR